MTDYPKHTWQPDDDQSAARLTNMETGIDTLHSELATHEANVSNPHALTAAQILAVKRQAGATNISVQASAPSSGLVTGDLWIDTTTNQLKRYTGAAWARVLYSIHRWDGDEWKGSDLLYWTGSVWQEIEFLSVVFSDDFNRGNGPLDGDDGWDAFLWTISGNRATWPLTSPAGAFAVAVRPDTRTDVYAECVPKSHNIGPIVRALNNTEGYAAVRSGDQMVLYKITGALTKSILDNSFTVPNLTSDVLRVEAIGTQIRVLINGSEVLIATDAVYASGLSGLWADDVAGPLQADNFNEAAG